MLASGMNVAGAGLTGAAALAKGITPSTTGDQSVSGASALQGQTSAGGGSASAINGPNSNESPATHGGLKGDTAAANPDSLANKYEYSQQAGISISSTSKNKNKKNQSGASMMRESASAGSSTPSLRAVALLLRLRIILLRMQKKSIVATREKIRMVKLLPQFQVD